MKKLLTFFLLLAIASAFAQVPLEKLTPALQQQLSTKASDQEVLLWVFFKDKGPDIQRYYLSPESVVSARALKIRSKVLAKSNLISFIDLPVYQNYVDQLEDLGFRVNYKTKWFNGVSGFIKKSLIPQISGLTFVKNMDVVYKLKKDYNEVKLNESRPQQRNEQQHQLNKINTLNYGLSFTQDNQINIPAVHDEGYYGQGINICLMDAGFSLLSHEAFDSLYVIAKWDFVNHDSTVGNVAGDSGEGSHGTETLSTIAGYMPGQLIGPAFKAHYILAKTENTDSETPIEEDNWIAAAEWADSIGVDVTSTSLGYLTFDPGWENWNYTWQDMDGNTCRITIGADNLASHGVVVVNSAGNEGYNGSHNTLVAPADGDSVIAAGSVDASGNYSYFSSVGPTVDGRIKPDVAAMGDFDYVADPNDIHGYTHESGTSFSCPLSAGVAALILCVNPNLTNMQVREAMWMTASIHNNPNNELGYGILDALAASQYWPLPVELASFTASVSQNNVILNWTTATEQNNHGFQVQRKPEGGTFTTIGFVNGSGSSTTQKTYTFTDNNPLFGKSFYRLKQVDFNGTYKYSQEVSVNVNSPVDYQVYQNYPNPFNPSTTLSYYLPKASNVQLTIYNILGKEIRVLLQGNQDAGLHRVEFNAENLSSGMYIAEFTANTFRKAIKMTLMK
jgi:serine protease AprX